MECHLVTQQDTKGKGAPRQSPGVAGPCATGEVLNLGPAPAGSELQSESQAGKSFQTVAHSPKLGH